MCGARLHGMCATGCGRFLRRSAGLTAWRNFWALGLPRGLRGTEWCEFAVSKLGGAAGVATVREVARSTGWSERRFSQVFREEVGLPPKVWCRIQRFQRAVQQLHAGADMQWADLALDCGFYDQSHFANEFKAFSGIDATTYSALRSRWANHIVVE